MTAIAYVIKNIAKRSLKSGNGHYPPDIIPRDIIPHPRTISPPAVYICLYLTKWSRGFQICVYTDPLMSDRGISLRWDGMVEDWLV